jgi:DnaJ family protein C protein 28
VHYRKEISEELATIRSELRSARQKLGPPPLGDRQLDSWHSTLLQIKEDRVGKVNKRIDKFNLIVPLLNSQMFRFNLDREAEKVLESGYQPPLQEVEKRAASNSTQKGNSSSADQSPKSLTDLITRLFG